MAKFLITPTHWIYCIVFLFISSHLCASWTTTGLHWINTILLVVKITANLLIAFLIGIKLSQLTHQRHYQSLLFISVSFLFIQATSYPFLNTIHTSSWFRWLIPQAAGLFIAAALMALGLIITFRLRTWRHYLALAILLCLLTISHQHTLTTLSYLFIATMTGYCIVKRKVKANYFFAQSGSDIQPSFYITLALVPLLSQWAPPFPLDMSLLTRYLLCVLGSFFILFVASSNLVIHISQWISGWINWISGDKAAQHSRSALHAYLQKIIRSRFFLTAAKLIFILFRTALIILIAIYVIELPAREWSVMATKNWIIDSSFYVAISCISVFCLYTILRILLNRIAASILLLLFIAIVSSVNFLKLRYLGTPLVPSDFNLVNQAFESLIFIAGKSLALFIYSSIFLLFFLFTLIVWRYSNTLLNKNPWIGLRGLAGFSLLFWLLLQPGKLALDSHLPNAWESGNSSGLYTHAGLITGFIFRYQQFYIHAPEGFSNQSIRSLAASLNIQATTQPIVTTRLPHIIAIQSEAFWDPGNLHSNLYPHGSPGDLTVLCQNKTLAHAYCHSGYVEVPVYGGSTANSEFEFLTGLSMQLLPPGTVPFVHYIQKPTPSIGWQLRQAHYQTLGIHPNSGWFWNRDKVYPLLGFQEFMDIKAFDGAEKNQFYVTDLAINQLIKQRIDQATQAQFIFAVTMANHAPFADSRYSSQSNEPIDWEQLPMLTAEEQQIIKTYSIGAREARLALEDLINTYSKANAAPVIIVFYGDHLPILGENYSIYRKTGFKTEAMSDYSRELYSTPYLVWSNQKLSRPLAQSMTVSLLGQEIIGLAGLGNSGLQQMLSQLQEAPLLRKPSAQAIPNEQQPHLTEQQKTLATLYKHASFDALFDQHSLGFFGLESPLVIDTVTAASQ